MSWDRGFPARAVGAVGQISSLRKPNVAVLMTVGGCLLAYASMADTRAPTASDISEGHSELSRDIAGLKRYADGIDGGLSETPHCGDSGIANPATGQCAKAQLADVETMIARLAQRLETKPDDAAGWRTLGWSYASTGRPLQAVDAYRHAVRLNPDDAEVQAALSAAEEEAKLAPVR